MYFCGVFQYKFVWQSRVLLLCRISQINRNWVLLSFLFWTKYDFFFHDRKFHDKSNKTNFFMEGDVITASSHCWSCCCTYCKRWGWTPVALFIRNGFVLQASKIAPIVLYFLLKTLWLALSLHVGPGFVLDWGLSVHSWHIFLHVQVKWVGNSQLPVCVNEIVSMWTGELSKISLTQ